MGGGSGGRSWSSSWRTSIPTSSGLQEVRRFPGQARWIARHTGPQERPWEVRTAYKTGLKRFWEGIGVLSRPPVTSHARLRLEGGFRVAQRVTVVLPDGGTLDVYNTHLADGDAAVRAAQARQLLAWMDERPDVAQVLVGDLNSRPGSAPITVLTSRLRSAYALVHGTEPPRTVPGNGVLDYVLVNDLVVVLDARVTLDRPSPDDPSLLPSDHFGVTATIRVLPPR